MNTKPWFITAVRANTIILAALTALLAATAPTAWAVTEVFTATGTSTWTAPPGVTSVTVAAWGAGGGGGDPSGNNGGGGGGAGAYASSVVTVVPGVSYSFTVGAGGVGGAGVGLATNGGSSSFGTTTVVAAGGSGTSTAAAGAGGTIAASTGVTKFAGCAGGTGQNGNNKPGGGGGGSPTSSGICTAGGNASANAGGTSGTGDGAGGAGSSTVSNGSNGSQPGGGGGGASDFDGSSAGNGGNGKVQLTYTPCTCVPQNGNLIANPDFEELCASTIVQDFGAVNGGTVKMRNGVCGWSMNGAGMETWENTTTTPASRGTVFVEIDGYSTTVDCLSQNVATTPGIAYTLKVDYRARTSTLEGLIVKWNGTQMYSTTAAPTSAWQTITVPGLTATGNDLIEFCEPSASNNSLGSWIDNVRLQVFFPDHYEVSVPSSNIACLASTVKVTVCADSSSPCTNALAVPTTTTANLATSAGTLASGALTFGASGIVTTALSYPAAADGATATLTLSGESVPGANARTCCVGNTCSTSDTCVATFKTAGFIVSSTAGGTAATIPTQTAGTSSSSYYLRAVKTNTTTKACESALSGAQNVNWAAQCNNPTTCSSGNLMSLSGNATTAAGSNAIASNPNTGVTSTTPVSMTFDADGNAPFSFNYADVGQMTLYASIAAGGTLLTPLAGNSNAFVVKPGGFALSSIKCTSWTGTSCAPALASPGNNPAAASAAGAAFIQAGQRFSATVTATTSGGTPTPTPTPTPNYGKETSPEGVRLTPTLVLPSGGANPALANANAFGSFSAGAATGTTFAWPEVGIITLTPSVGDGDYLGAGDATGTSSDNIGRFIPAFFNTTVTPGCSGFTYSGQPMTVTVTAKATGGSTTTNYSGANWARTLTLTDANSVAGSFTAGSTLNAASFSNGVASNATTIYTFNSPATAPSTIKLRASEPALADGISSAIGSEGTQSIRSGRIRLQNAYGSELLSAGLPLPIALEFFDTTPFGWRKDTGTDTCTNLVAANFAFTAAAPGCNTSATSCLTALAVTQSGTGPYKAPWKVNLAKPTGSGSLCITLNLDGTAAGNQCIATGAAGPSPSSAAMPWLKHGWTSSTPSNPAASIVFGSFKSPLIYRRENY